MATIWRLLVRPGMRERLPMLLIGCLLVFQVLAIFRHEYDSDEAQHLHLVYGWSRGELPYRDRFDNHTPLLYVLFLPLAALAGETPYIVLLARLAEYPLVLATLLLVYQIARKLTDREIALWTVAITLALADWSLKSVEFRPDVLWCLLWFLAIWVLVREAQHPRAQQFFLTGLVMGAALCASIKTTFLVPALVVGWAGAWIFSEPFRRAIPARKIGIFAVAGSVGFLTVPAIVFGSLIAKGTTLETIRFCLFDANKAPFEPIRVVVALVLAPFAFWVAWRIARGDSARGGILAALFLTLASYVLALWGFSPELRKQTFLVAYPLIILFAIRLTAGILRKFDPRWVSIAGALACLIAFVYLIVEGRLWNDGLRGHRSLLTDTLNLTSPGDYVLDRKGETIFRKRPVYLVYQHATVRGFEEGRLARPDTAILSRTGTAVAVSDLDGLTPEMREYLKSNYLPVGSGALRVAGEVLKPSWEDGHWVERATIEVPGKYVLIKEGAPVEAVVVEQAGPQVFDFGNDRRRALLLWKKAWDAGFRPTSDALEVLDSKAS